MKTSELTGAALDWAVAKCEGENSVASCYYADDNTPLYLDEAPQPTWEPSTDWAQGGPIIEREGISLYLDTNNMWQANIFDGNPGVFGVGVEGETALIAAMRCFVASKFGDEVEIPEELK